MIDNFNNLRLLLSEYFHQDWSLEGRTDAEVVNNFSISEPEAQKELTILDIDRIIEAHSKDECKIEEILAELGCFYYYEDDGLTAGEWLKRLRYLLSLQNDSPPSSGLQ